eukprot:4898987-Pyramimonas_sp.AAC.1
MPESWRGAPILTIFKKGDTSGPSNDRPISSLAVLRRVLASIIMHRLKTGGVEKRLRESRCGFRPNRLIDAT